MPIEVFLTRQCGVKILDFGLAKLMEPLGRIGAFVAGPEVSTAGMTEELLTRSGTALGTFLAGLYMPDVVSPPSWHLLSNENALCG
jgi:hypothetical protein